MWQTPQCHCCQSAQWFQLSDFKYSLDRMMQNVNSFNKAIQQGWIGNSDSKMSLFTWGYSMFTKLIPRFIGVEFGYFRKKKKKKLRMWNRWDCSHDTVSQVHPQDSTPPLWRCLILQFWFSGWVRLPLHLGPTGYYILQFLALQHSAHVL